MRFLSAVLVTALALPQLACHGHTSHRTHIVETDGGLDIEIVRGDDEHWASYKRDGVRYVTKDAAVLAQIEKAMEKHHAISRVAESDAYREIGKIFERAVREGKAKRD